ncbi:Cytosolic Fe-S cluster assembly factor NUBP2 like protein [Cucumispora dikerogammari]|nr:Cytosolic Fe-S cluster assembly factor NUBP2 like protein [Cucumispora dikerogammari]
MKIAILSGKGGVGKSTISALFALYLSDPKTNLSNTNKASTLILDFDISGPSISILFPITSKLRTNTDNNLIPIKIKENLYSLSMGYLISPSDAVTWKLPKKVSLLQNFLSSINDYENVIIDTPPDDFFIPILKSHNFSILFVTTSQNLALQDLCIQIDKCKEKEIYIIGVLENMSGFKCQNCNKINYLLSKKGGELVCEKYKLKFLGALPNNQGIRDCVASKALNEEVSGVFKSVCQSFITDDNSQVT